MTNKSIVVLLKGSKQILLRTVILTFFKRDSDGSENGVDCIGDD